MKKIILIAMVFFALVSCTEAKAPEVEVVAADTAAVVTETVAPTATVAVETASAVATATK